MMEVIEFEFLELLRDSVRRHSLKDSVDDHCSSQYSTDVNSQAGLSVVSSSEVETPSSSLERVRRHRLASNQRRQVVVSCEMAS